MPPGTTGAVSTAEGRELPLRLVRQRRLLPGRGACPGSCTQDRQLPLGLVGVGRLLPIERLSLVRRRRRSSAQPRLQVRKLPLVDANIGVAEDQLRAAWRKLEPGIVKCAPGHIWSVTGDEGEDLLVARPAAEAGLSRGTDDCAAQAGRQPGGDISQRMVMAPTGRDDDPAWAAGQRSGQPLRAAEPLAQGGAGGMEDTIDVEEEQVHVKALQPAAMMPFGRQAHQRHQGRRLPGSSWRAKWLVTSQARTGVPQYGQPAGHGHQRHHVRLHTHYGAFHHRRAEMCSPPETARARAFRRMAYEFEERRCDCPG